MLSFRKKSIIVGAVMGALTPLLYLVPSLFMALNFDAAASVIDGALSYYFWYIVIAAFVIYSIYTLKGLMYEDKHHHMHYRWRSCLWGAVAFGIAYFVCAYVIATRAQTFSTRSVDIGTEIIEKK